MNVETQPVVVLPVALIDWAVAMLLMVDDPWQDEAREVANRLRDARARVQS